MINHGVSSAFLEKVKKEVHEFFNLRMEEKKKYWQRPEDLEGFGQAYVLSEEQKFVWGDGFIMTTLPVNLRKPHLFPKLPLPLRFSLCLFLRHIGSLLNGVKISNHESDIENGKSFKHQKEEEMKNFFENGLQVMRMNYYPPCPQPEKVAGLTPHSDGCGLTILLQINEVEGLQIKKDGMWIPLTPLPNAFLVNVGDIMEIITNGKYRSIEHRATVNSVQERLSVGTFYYTRYDGEVYPASSLISEKAPALFRRLTVEEYLSGRFARELRGKSYLDVLRIQHGQG
ncbi:hypothetical protein WN943_014587 [Citrus x changshan-huyou]